MKIGVIGDDFTGSSDVANSLAKAGARTLQYVGIPAAPLTGDIDASVISLKSRSIPVARAVEQSLAACRWLTANGAEQILFKYCSTFDSTPEGNIGPVAAALLEEVDAPLALVCPAFPANGRTVYNGHLFVGDRLLSESGMQNHPLTPMTDPDLRRWLALQTSMKVGFLALRDVRGHATGRLAGLEREGARLILADAVEDDDLLRLGEAARGHRLVTGGSGIAMGLPANFGIKPRGPAQSFKGAAGPAIVFSGSCSNATREQVAVYGADHPALKIDLPLALDHNAAIARATAFIEAHRGDAPLIYSTDEPGTVAADQAKHGRQKLADAYEGIFAELTRVAIERGFRRIIAAGGETSGAVAMALGGDAFEIGPEIATGVPALLTTGNPRLAVALKSGNFGERTFFEKALSVLSGKS